MSIMIKGMEMPEKCEKCDLCFLIKGEYFCQFLYEPVNFEIEAGKRSEYCPLVPVPPHGDLIDRDALMNSDGDLWDGMWGWSGVQIANAPAIIPASEEGET